MRSGFRRLLSSGIAVVLGVAFMAAALLLGDALNATMRSTVGGTVGTASVFVSHADRESRDQGPFDPAFVASLQSAPGITKVKGQVTTMVGAETPSGDEASMLVHEVPDLTASTTLKSGRLPVASGEVLVSAAAANEYGMAPGQVLHTHADKRPAELAVVGVLNPGSDATATTTIPELYMPDADLLAAVGGYDTLLVWGSGTQEQVRDTVAALPTVKAARASVQTGQAVIDEQMKELSGQTVGVVGFIMAFAVIALFVSALVISNTFGILVAQRTRQLALLRAIGAKRSQVFGSVVREALLMGVVASTIGVALGYGLLAIAVALSPKTGIAFTAGPFSWSSTLVPIAVGVLITVVASLAPARSATKVPPLAALRAQEVSGGRPLGTARIVAGALLVLAGVAALVAGAMHVLPEKDPTGVPVGLVLGMAGGIVSFVGVLMLLPLAVGPVAAVSRGPISAFGVAGDLATDNAGRNPRRAGSVISALTIGVTLITMLTVGSASATATMQGAIDGRNPVDAIAVSTSDTDVPTSSVGIVKGVQGVQDAALIPIGEGSLTWDGGHTEQVLIRGLDASSAPLTRNPRLIEGLADGVVIVPPELKIPDGARVTWADNNGRPVTLTAKTSVRSTSPVIVTPATLSSAGAPAAHELWIRYTDQADPNKAAGELRQAFRAQHVDVQLRNGASERALYQHEMDTILGVVVGLLAVAVLVAVVGMINSLSLSVLERTRELGVVRALGLTRGQTRRSITLEGIILGLGSVVIGLVLGLGYGIAATYALLGTMGHVLLDIPGGRLAIIAVVALALAWLASAIPARRASRVSPVEALAAD